MSCPGCLPNQQELARQLQTITTEAKRNAIANKTLYIIYKDSGNIFRYMEASAAKNAGITPSQVHQYISHLQSANDG